MRLGPTRRSGGCVRTRRASGLSVLGRRISSLEFKLSNFNLDIQVHAIKQIPCALAVILIFLSNSVHLIKAKDILSNRRPLTAIDKPHLRIRVSPTRIRLSSSQQYVKCLLAPGVWSVPSEKPAIWSPKSPKQSHRLVASCELWPIHERDSNRARSRPTGSLFDDSSKKLEQLHQSRTNRPSATRAIDNKGGSSRDTRSRLPRPASGSELPYESTLRAETISSRGRRPRQLRESAEKEERVPDEETDAENTDEANGTDATQIGARTSSNESEAGEPGEVEMQNGRPAENTENDDDGNEVTKTNPSGDSKLNKYSLQVLSDENAEERIEPRESRQPPVYPPGDSDILYSDALLVYVKDFNALIK